MPTLPARCSNVVTLDAFCLPAYESLKIWVGATNCPIEPIVTAASILETAALASTAGQNQELAPSPATPTFFCDIVLQCLVVPVQTQSINQ